MERKNKGPVGEKGLGGERRQQLWAGVEAASQVGRGLLSVTGMSHPKVRKHGVLLQGELKLWPSGGVLDVGDGQMECGLRPRTSREITKASQVPERAGLF